LKIQGEVDPYVSRGAHKLIGALDFFGTENFKIDNSVCLDAGASTGGFTQVLLENGAAQVICVDVGYGQLAWQLQSDSKVVRIDRTNIRELSISELQKSVTQLPSFVVADLSFISLRLVIDKLIELSSKDAQMLLLVKPQFELDAKSVGQNGVVREPELRVKAVTEVAQSAIDRNLFINGICASPLPGPAGNVEYFIWISKTKIATRSPLTFKDGSLATEISTAITSGPQ
jgi:23S rRNA (cytidine1920-2'-O)/16S rRNA (cytidine1409-2'-O)-methyltransferase